MAELRRLISIAIPAVGYENYPQYLDHNLELLAQQTWKNFEVIVSDDCEDDTIEKICRGWSGQLHVRVFKHKSTGFIASNLNNAMKNCKGEYIKILCADDMIVGEHTLEGYKIILEQNPNIKWLSTNFIHTQDGVNWFNPYEAKWNDKILYGLNTLGNMSNILIKNEDILLFDENLNWLVDCEYYHRMYVKYGEPYFMKYVTVACRVNTNGSTDNMSQEQKDKELEYVKQKYDTNSNGIQ